MKKLIVTTAAMLMTVGAFAQGTVYFANAATTQGLTTADRQVTFSTSAALFNPLLVAGANVSSNYAGVNLSGLRAGLLYAPTSVTDLTAYSLATFASGYPTFKSSTSAVAGSWFSKDAGVNLTSRQSVNMVAVVWDSSLAANPLDKAALSGLWGASAPFLFTMPDAGAPAQDFMLHNLRAFSIGIVPEPTSFALLGLGAAAMLIFRRRS